MLIELITIGIVLTLFMLPFIFPSKKRVKPIRLPKNYNDTSDASYCINEHGVLEEIQHGRLESRAE
ncbi:MAG TPA: hypothetical protein VHA56_06035 [Mucilaginibacter sp.]|nr:hypothetical protein [Mucilaginibacter sp.]